LCRDIVNPIDDKLLARCCVGIAHLTEEEVTMSAVAEVLSSDTPRPAPRASDMPDCPICADSLVAAEGSAFSTNGEVSYLWSCETCGYGFVTRHAMKKAFVCS
jgi:hypothetical protein